MPTHSDVLQGVVQCVPQMQRSGNIGWRNDNGERAFVRIGVGTKDSRPLPNLNRSLYMQIGNRIDSVFDLRGRSWCRPIFINPEEQTTGILYSGGREFR